MLKAHCLQLFLAAGGGAGLGGDAGEEVDALFGFGHLLLIELPDLFVDLLRAARAPLVDVLHLANLAPREAGHVAQHSVSRLLHIPLHVFALLKLVTHGAVGLLLVGLAAVARLFVEVPDGGPAALARVVLGAVDLVGLQVDVRERHVGVARKLLHDVVPGRSLLDSSPSPFARDPAHEHGAAGVHLGFDVVLVVGHRELGAEREVVGGVDAPGGVDGARAQQQRREGARQQHGARGAEEGHRRGR
mmetsp:Transcript_7402/g.18836  ORF Transcript_7402/g.18836 Transcript_7402/m.18836 type:complete len:246 (-) Transcript_7402:9-746(-)